MSDTLKSALGNATSSHEFKGKSYQLEEWDLNDVADIEEQIGDIGKLNPLKSSHLAMILWIAMRRCDDMLTPDERRAGRWRMTLRDVGSIVKASDLRKPDAILFASVILTASGILPEEEKKTEVDPEEPEAPSVLPGETL